MWKFQFIELIRSEFDENHNKFIQQIDNNKQNFIFFNTIIKRNNIYYFVPFLW